MPLPTERGSPAEWGDRHKLWRRVLSDYEELKAITPEGFHPVVLVFVRSLATPLEIGFVKTLRDPDYPWVRFELAASVPREEGGPVPPDAQWIYVHESDVERVEMKLQEAPAFDFFKFEVLDEDTD